MEKLLLSLRGDGWGYWFITLDAGSKEITFSTDGKQADEIRNIANLPEDSKKLEQAEVTVNLKKRPDRYLLVISGTEDKSYSAPLRDDVADKLLTFGIKVTE